MVYKRTITRFIADDKGCLSGRETGDAFGFRQQLSIALFEAFQLEITVIILCIFEWGMPVSRKI